MSCDGCGNGEKGALGRLLPGLGPNCPERQWCSFEQCIQQKTGVAHVPPDIWAEINAIKARLSALENNGLTVELPPIPYGLPLSPVGMIISGGTNTTGSNLDIGTFGMVVIPESGKITGVTTYIVPQDISAGSRYGIRVRVYSGFDAYQEYTGKVQIGQDTLTLDIDAVAGMLVVAWPTGVSTQGDDVPVLMSETRLAIEEGGHNSVPVDTFTPPSPYGNAWNVPRGAYLTEKFKNIGLVSPLDDEPDHPDTIPSNVKGLQHYGASLTFSASSVNRVAVAKFK